MDSTEVHHLDHLEAKGPLAQGRPLPETGGEGPSHCVGALARAGWVAGEGPRAATAASPFVWALKALLRTVHVLVAIALFILALKLLQAGAQGLAPLLGRLSIAGPANALGFGWLGAYAMMSGSPVAATSLALFSGGLLSQIEAFFMVNGSRLGASFLILSVGFLRYRRGRGYADAVYIGLIAFIVTGTIYIPAMALGGWALGQGWLEGSSSLPVMQISSGLETLYGPAVAAAKEHLPRAALFLLGAGLLWGSFHLFDAALPQIEAGKGPWRRVGRLLRNRYAMFALGLLVTALTLSVAVSVTLLIPLSLKGYLGRRQVVPYIMGANISTFVDTFVASLLLAPGAPAIVLAVALSVSVVTGLVLVLLYRPYQRLVVALAHGATRSSGALALSLLILFLIPLALLLL